MNKPSKGLTRAIILEQLRRGEIRVVIFPLERSCKVTEVCNNRNLVPDPTQDFAQRFPPAELTQQKSECATTPKWHVHQTRHHHNSTSSIKLISPSRKFICIYESTVEFKSNCITRPHEYNFIETVYYWVGKLVLLVRKPVCRLVAKDNETGNYLFYGSRSKGHSST